MKMEVHWVVSENNTRKWSDPNHHQAFLSVGKFTPECLKFTKKYELLRFAFFNFIMSFVPLVV